MYVYAHNVTGWWTSQSSQPAPAAVSTRAPLSWTGTLHSEAQDERKSEQAVKGRHGAQIRSRCASNVRIVGEKRGPNGGEKTDDQTDRLGQACARKSGRPGDAFGPRGVSRTNSYADHRQRCSCQSDHDGNHQVAMPWPAIAFTPNRPMAAVRGGGARFVCTALSADGTSPSICRQRAAPALAEFELRTPIWKWFDYFSRLLLVDIPAEATRSPAGRDRGLVH